MVSALGGLVFGYELGIISGALLQLKVEFSLSCVQQEALVSSLLLGALLASTLGGWLIDRHGRRNAILLSNVLILAGSLVLLISCYPALVVGRATVGFAMSISSMSCCIFVSEVVSADRRGCMVTLYEAGITVGILLAYAVNYVLSGCSGGWKWMFGFAVVPTVLQLVSVGFLTPGTKRTVSYCGQTDRALVSSDGAQEPEEPGHSASKDRKTVDSWYLFQSQDNMRTRTLLGLGLVLFQQFTGQPNILFYASTIFSSLGSHSTHAALLASTGLGLVKVVSTLTAMVLSDRVGRRTMLISGCCVMALSLMVIGLFSGPMRAQDSCRSVNATLRPQDAVGNRSVFDVPALSVNNNNSRASQTGPQSLTPAQVPGLSDAAENWLILVCMMAVVAAYSTGFGPSLSFFFFIRSFINPSHRFIFKLTSTLISVVFYPLILLHELHCSLCPRLTGCSLFLTSDLASPD